MTTNNSGIKQDIVQQQQKIIAALREQNSKLTQRVEYLSEIADEYKTIKQLTVQGMTIQQAQMTQNEKMNAINRARNEQRRFEKDQEYALKQAERDSKLVNKYENLLVSKFTSLIVINKLDIPCKKNRKIILEDLIL